MSNITTTINIDDPYGGHQRIQRLIGLATNIIIFLTRLVPKIVHSSSTNCTVLNLHTYGNDAGHVQYENVSLQYKLQPLYFKWSFSPDSWYYLSIFQNTNHPTTCHQDLTNMLLLCTQIEAIFLILMTSDLLKVVINTDMFIVWCHLISYYVWHSTSRQ